MAGPSGKGKGGKKPLSKADSDSEGAKEGRPRIEVDVDMLAKLCQLQCTADECAHVLGLSTDTIDRRLKEEGWAGFEAFKAENCAMGRVSLRRAQYQTAMAGNHTMQIWLGKQWLGQQDKIEPEAPDDPEPLEVKFEVMEAVGPVRVTKA